ncbi:MAG: SDR family NAD(P)-dependent oxidoreductase [Bacteroidota bacterium]|nr:SDR family NAD(P)-dependent oxidoreductase [Bacteroidota bacterium]
MNNQNLFKIFPGRQVLLDELKNKGEQKVLLVNGHFHTPYSFSAFTEIEQLFQMAKMEGVQVLGINDFYTTDGYTEFADLSKKYKIFPLFNIEFMALQSDEQAKGIRVNDPANPGRTYMSGKGLTHPLKIGKAQSALLEQVQHESNVQTAEMVEKLNAFLNEIHAGFNFTFDELKTKYAKNMLRERHIAKALREAIDEKFSTLEEKKAFYTLVFSGKDAKSDLNDATGLENEIRGNLLKTGGRAFVPEDPKAFLSLEQVREVIISAGGIPCYPVLLDDPKGNFTDFEGDKEELYRKLVEKKIFSIELIPGRNDFAILKDFVKFFRSKNFLISFGTEHNTPQLDPVKVSCRGGVELDEELNRIGYEGACIIAAHQYLVAKGEEGYLDIYGRAKTSQYDAFVELGQAVIGHFIGASSPTLLQRRREHVNEDSEHVVIKEQILNSPPLEGVGEALQELIEVSQHYGRQKDFVIAGGGNTSYKDENHIYIKASGFSLATIGEDGFAQLDRKALQVITEKNYSEDVMERENQIKNDLLNARVHPEKGQRPSVETSLHNLLNFRFVVHTHSTKVNGLMCGKDAEKRTADLFDDEVVFVPYTDPGYILYKEVENRINAFRSRTNAEPKIILLQNHGIFVAADTIAEIQRLYDQVISKLDNAIGEIPQLVGLSVDPVAVKIIPAIRMMLSANGLKTLKVVNNSYYERFLSSEAEFYNIALPFIPDVIVYCNSSFIYAEYTGDVEVLLNELSGKIKAYIETQPKTPKIICIKGIGCILASDNAQGVATLEDVMMDTCLVSLYSEKFGGQSPMTPEQVQFIDTWEVEQYRSAIAMGATAGRVDRKIAIVTGGAQGFGAGIVENLMENGANVVIADLNEEKGKEFADSLNVGKGKNKAYFVKADVSHAASVENLILQTVCEFGGLDIFISNAGILRAGGLDEMTPETFELMTKVNYSAYFLCAKYASEVLKLQNQYKPDHFTDIIQINSKSGLKGSNRNFAYAGGKFGGIGLTQSFAMELMPAKIKVNSICPGNFFDGPLWADPENGLFVQYLRAGKVPGATTLEDVKRFYEAQVPAGRGCTPLDVMRAVYYIIEQEYETGQAVPVTGGQNMLN